MSGVHEMRRSDREIVDPARIRSILERGRFITLALIDGDEPYAVVLSYGLDYAASRLYFHVARAGHKLDLIAANPRVCGSIVIEEGYTEGECEHPFESAIVRGALRVVGDPNEKRHAIGTLVNHLEPDPDGYWSSRSWNLDSRIDGFTALALEIESITAKEGK